MPDKTDNIPKNDAGWKTFLQEREADPVVAILERGRRLALCLEHRKDTKRGGTFDDFVKSTIGIAGSTARELALIGNQADALTEVRATLRDQGEDLPASQGALIEMSMLARDFPDALDAYMSDGSIASDMTRKDAKALLRGARQAAEPPEPVDLDELADTLITELKAADRTKSTWRFRVETIRDEMEALLAEVPTEA